MTKLAPQLPKDEGLSLINRQLIETPTARQVLIVVVDTKKTETDIDSGYTEATARIQAVEAITDLDQLAVLDDLLRRAGDRRNGRIPIPGFDLRTASGMLIGRSDGGDD